MTTPQDELHTYTLDWSQNEIEYLIDGSLVRKVEHSEQLVSMVVINQTAISELIPQTLLIPAPDYVRQELSTDPDGTQAR